MTIKPQQIDPDIMKAIEALKEDCDKEIRRKAGLPPKEKSFEDKVIPWLLTIAAVLAIGMLEPVVEFIARL
jgi:hypothetical protein